MRQFLEDFAVGATVECTAMLAFFMFAVRADVRKYGTEQPYIVRNCICVQTACVEQCGFCCSVDYAGLAHVPPNVCCAVTLQPSHLPFHLL